MNDTVISSRNDPDYVQLTRSSFEINKNYMELITKYLSGSDKKRQSIDHDIVIKNDIANYVLSRSSLERLKPRKWLNDEVVNAYISLVNQRPAQKAYVMNTFFYTMLEDMRDRSDYVYTKCERILKRKKVNLADYQLTIVPVNITGSHWFLAAFEHEI